MDTNLFMQNLQAGIIVTCIGMLSVLVFLTVMIWAMGIMEKVIIYLNKKFPPKVQDEPKKDKKPSLAEEEIAVAIAAVLSRRHKA